MAKRLHKDVPASENHVIHGWEVANQAARLALTPAATDLGRVARQASDGTMWACVSNAPATWRKLDTDVGSDTFVATGRTAARAPQERAAEVFNVRDFGAKGDGVTDDYASLQAMVTVVNAAGGGTVVFPKGVYKINQRYASGNGIHDFIFSACSKLTIEGCGSKIDMLGLYTRTASTDNTLGFQFLSCTDLIIRDLEVDGNNDQTTHGTSSQTPNHGINICGCERVTLENVWSHHHPMDGLELRDSGGTSAIISKHVTVLNSRFDYNGRQGCSIVGARWCTFVNTAFLNTGRSSYGLHSPSAGVDIEPQRWPGLLALGGAGDADDYSGDIHFLQCTFKHNIGSEFAGSSAVHPDYSSIPGAMQYPVTFTGCQFIGKVGDRGEVKHSMKYANFIGCTFEELEFKPAYGASVPQGERTLVSGCTFKCSQSSLSTIRYIRTDGELIIQDSMFFFTGTSKVAEQLYINATGTCRVRFEGNYTWVSAAMHDGVTRDSTTLVLTNAELANNVWETDLSTAGLFWNITAVKVTRDRYLNVGFFSPSTAAYNSEFYTGGVGILGPAAARANAPTYSGVPAALANAATQTDLNALGTIVNDLLAKMRTANLLA